VQSGAVTVRPVRPEEADELGAITVAAYAALPGHVEEPDYDAELADVATRAKVAEVLVAVDDDDRVLGGVTFVPDGENPLAEHTVADASTIRMLAVAGRAQGRGVGEALVRACIERAREVGSRHVVLHSTPWMEAAHRLYGRLGFVRRPDLDWTPVPDIPLLGFSLDL
jgi:GNAT superfamily N-acetyltransferase